MTKLFNKFGVPTEELRGFSDEIERQIRKFIREHYDDLTIMEIRAIEQVLNGYTGLSYFIVMKQRERRNEERDKNKND
jgi:hypothetical protein